MAHELADATNRRVMVIEGPTFSDRMLEAGDDPHGIAFVMHTSGTTGLPKPVPVREASLQHRADVNGRLLNLKLAIGSSPRRCLGSMTATRRESP